MRVFVAFDIPENIKEKILELEKEIARITKRIRLTAKPNMHITVKFLGEQPSQSVNRIVEILKGNSEKFDRFRISLNKAGVFKSLENPSVLWLGEFNSIFESISNTINKELEIFRKADNKPFCHLTIGRMKGISKEEIIEALRVSSDFAKSNDLSFEVEGFYLYESKLYKKGAEYNKLEKFMFKEK
ncbi:RNA 2',3'-cyclic phosphodiesterase [Hippea alviniae]|uniref:RNA 2',3'-cyclic phosphodiesterase n=1 Tax=Hippea alviniae TaxID=1279027 RepID=UPI0003B324AB|nr:RNA 2',3'-cyclic phosphodiesterase [Hippea alviniae]